MEKWETLVGSFPSSPDLKQYIKLMNLAEVTLKQDLAPFEIEWFIDTLLFKPVELLSMIASKRNDNTWGKILEDSFKLLSDVIGKCPDYVERHLENIIKVCQLTFKSQIQKQVYHCLMSICKVSDAIPDPTRYVTLLTYEENNTCRGLLAQFVGSLCEYHPETVANEPSTIWRLYLNLLDDNKCLEVVTSGVLQGMIGLLKNFGRDLPTMELSNFCNNLSTKYIKITRCHESCFKILELYADLFPPLLKDDKLRAYLFSVSHDGCGTGPLLAIYKAICDSSTKEEVEHIIDKELIKHINSKHSPVKYTVMRVLAYMGDKHGVSLDVKGAEADAQTLEFELRSGRITFECSEAISWCIETNRPDSEKLLQTAILLEENLPATKRKEIIVYGILKATPEVRNTTIIFLITETCQDMDKYLPIWRQLFDLTDPIVQETSKVVFEVYMEYLEFCLDMCESELPPEKLSPFLRLTSHLLPLLPTDDYIAEHCAICLPKVTRIASVKGSVCASATAAGRCMCAHLEDGCAEFYEIIQIDRCHDEATLVESCMALVQAAGGLVDSRGVLAALQIMFSRNDVESKMLSQCLRKFEQMICTEKEKFDEKCIADIIFKIDKLRSRKDITDKDGRVLRRDVVMFLGKYGGSDVSGDDFENAIVARLKNILVLKIPNTVEGTTCKINLNRILQLAIVYEEPKALQTMLIVLCDNLSSTRNSDVQYALSLVARAISRANARGANINPSWLQQAVCYCDTVHCLKGMLMYMSTEMSPGVRKMMSNALEGLLLKNPGSERCEELMRSTVEYAGVMMRSRDATTKRAGLAIIETLTVGLKDSLTVEVLPDLLLSIPQTRELDSELAFHYASTLFLEKIQLFENDTIEKIIKNLIRFLLIDDKNIDTQLSTTDHKSKMADETNRKVTKITVKMILEFIKTIYNLKKYSEEKKLVVFSDILKNESGVNVHKSLYVLAELKTTFELNPDSCGRVLRLNNILNSFFEFNETFDYFVLEAILKFLTNYSEVLLETQYQKTLDLLSKIILKLTPEAVQYLQSDLYICLSTYNSVWKSLPQVLTSTFHDWCKNVPVEEITSCIQNKDFLTSHALVLRALNIYLNAFNFKDVKYILTDMTQFLTKWPRIILKYYANGYVERYLKSKMAYLKDILAVSLQFLTVGDVKSLILEGYGLKGTSDEEIGFRFCRRFIDIFIDIFLKKPFIMADEDMAPSCVLLNDITKFVIKRKCTEEECLKLLELVDSIWPTYDTHTNFTQKYSLLMNLCTLPKHHGPESNPLQWVIRTIGSEDTSSECRMKLIGVLPGGEAFSESYRIYASNLPSRLSECGVSLRALLDALASNGDLTLLDILATLSSGEQSKGTWDIAIDSCMASLAIKNDMSIYKAVYTRCWDGLSTGVCNRMLVPLLRYSTNTIAERFYCQQTTDLLSKLLKQQKVASTHYMYQKHLADYTRAFNILQVAFEKMSPQSLESPSSLLYSNIKPNQSWHLVREVCKLCVTLRKVISCPDEADEKLKEMYRLFHVSNYKCLAAAICRRRPDEHFYNFIFDQEVWNKLVSPDKNYYLPLRNQWYARTVRHAVSVDVSSETHRHGTYGTSTLRTRLFLRTLSENPLQYDLMPDTHTDVVVTQDLHLAANPLNSEDITAVFTAMLSHTASLSHTQWPHTLCEYLTGNNNTAGKWLLAQAICNCRKELKPYANVLRPALLAVTANTLITQNGVKLLNGLHVDILSTITEWRDDTHILSARAQENLNTIVYSLILTALENTNKQYAYKSTMDILETLIDMYKDLLNVDWTSFARRVKEIKKDFPKAGLKLVQRIVKDSEAMMNDLLSTAEEFVNKKQWGDMVKLSAFIGNALGCCENETLKMASLQKYRELLNIVRKQSQTEYIKMLFSSQEGYTGCCDEDGLKFVASLVQKLSTFNKTKCLFIISSFLSNLTETTFVTTDLFSTIDFGDIMREYTKEALCVVRDGMKAMGAVVRRRLVMLAADYCYHPVVKVRETALQVVVRALDDVLPNIPTQPQLKRLKTVITTPILKLLTSPDMYMSKILSVLGDAVSDCVTNVIEAVCRRLYADDMTVRFAECFLIAIYLPVTTSTSTNKRLDMSARVSALLNMFFHNLRSLEAFKRVKLRDEPLNISEQSPFMPTKLLTMSLTYQGTFRSYTRNRQTNVQHTPDAPSDIDVQIPIDGILETLLQFSKENSEVSQALCIEIVKCLLKRDTSSFDFGSVMRQMLFGVMNYDNGVSALSVDMARLFVDDDCETDGFKPTVERLRESTKDTEGEYSVQLLYEDVTLRRGDVEQFVLGSLDHDNCDILMEGATEHFSFEGLVSAFGKLSNWDNLTIQQRERVENTLPPLWTCNLDDFDSNYALQGNAGWLNKMLSASREENKQDSFKWLRDMDTWPRRRFTNSAVTEAIQWHSELSINIEDLQTLPSITPRDCAAEWVARLMIRRAYLLSLSHEDETLSQDVLSLSRSNELLWTRRVNEMALPKQALECITRNLNNLSSAETLQWMHQKVAALRMIGLKRNDSDILREALETAEENMVSILDDPNPDSIGMRKLILMLYRDLNELSNDTLKDIQLQVLKQASTRDDGLSSNNRNSLKSLCETMMTCYEDIWHETRDHTQQDELLSNMADVLGRMTDLDASTDTYADIILNKLNEYNGEMLPDAVGRNVLEKLQNQNLDDFAIDFLKSHSTLFPPALRSYSVISRRHRDELRYKSCLQLIGDASHLLAEYCLGLRKILTDDNTDKTQWKILFDRIKSKIFENPYSGSDYKLLTKYKDSLYLIQDYEPTDAFKANAKNILDPIISELKGKPPKSTLLLSQLCPVLISRPDDDDDGGLERLLGVTGTTVIKFEEQVSVFTDSVRRPVLFKVLLSNGNSKRYIHKSGEPLRVDASAQRVVKSAGKLWGGNAVGYNVTPLSEDCGLIEYLEDHSRIRDLISSSVSADLLEEVLESSCKQKEEEIILDSLQASLRKHNNNCSKVPWHALRSAIEDGCCSIQDFIAKKKRFQDTLASMTILTSLLGLGDRHLLNILYSVQDGGVCCVDWAAIFKYGDGELPSARLTRNLVAVCDTEVLESRLQSLLYILRNSNKTFVSSVKVSFKWMEQEFNEKLPYIEKIVQGKALSYEITKDVIATSDKIIHKEKYLQLLEEVFQDFERKECYSISEQVSSILRQSTDPRILSVTRAPWEPWL